jgi:hypothetical protein
MTLSDSTLLEVRNDLVAGIATSNRRRRSRRRLAAAIPAVAVAAGAALMVADRNDQPAYALTQSADGTIRVEVYPGFDDVGSLEDDLAAAGLQTVVIHLKGHPSLDGVVEVSSHNNETSGAIEFDNGEFVIEPATVEGEIEILIYSAADEGENYQFAPSIFAPDQALGGLPCAHPDTPLTTAELERRANDVGITNIEWVLFEQSASGEVGVEDLDARPDAAVSGAQLRNADTLLVTVTPDITEPAARTLSMSDGTHYRPTAHCTPELAARWD